MIKIKVRTFYDSDQEKWFARCVDSVPKSGLYGYATGATREEAIENYRLMAIEQQPKERLSDPQETWIEI